MKTNRIEAFSDGVMAIIITIMVLELKAPHDPTPASLAKMWPTFFAYVLSFAIIAIYWVNHHHLIHLITRVDSVILWANINLLFWLSPIPWVTVYLGDNHALPFPVALYAAVSTAGAIRFFAARIHRAASSRTGVQPVKQKNDTQKSHLDSHLRCRYPSRVHLHAACLNHDRVTGGNVFSS
jgi:uncharacterized membrane protein